MEEWRQLPEFPDRYEISNMGRLRRLGAGRGCTVGRIRRAHLLNGYPAFTIKIDNIPMTRYAHRMVASAFIGEIPPKWHVNHKDGNKANPVEDNLEIVTIGENRAHSYRVLGMPPNRGNKGAKHHLATLTWEQVCEVREAYRNGEGSGALAARFKTSRQTIYRIATGKLRNEC